MYTSSMTNSEIVEEFKKDLRFLDIKNENWLTDFRRAVLKSSKFPCIRTYQQKMSSNNIIYVLFMASVRGKHNNPDVCVYSVYDYNKKKRVITRTPTTNNKILPFYAENRYSNDGDYTILTDHFLERYQERVLKNQEMSKMDVINHCMSNLKVLISIEINDDLENVYHCFEGHYDNNNKDKIDYVSACSFGYNFGIIENNISIIKTVITKEQLKKNQRELFPLIKLMQEETESRYLNRK